MNISYKNSINIIETQENNYMDEAIKSFSLKHQLLQEFDQMVPHQIKVLISLYLTYPDYVNELKFDQNELGKLLIDTTGVNDTLCEDKFSCIKKIILTNTTQIIDENQLQLLDKIVANLFHFMKKYFTLNLFEDISMKPFTLFEFAYKNIVYYYPGLKYNPEFNSDQYKINLINFSNSGKRTIFNIARKNEFNYINENESNSKIMQDNPYLVYSGTGNAEVIYPFEDKDFKDKNIFGMISVNLRKENEIKDLNSTAEIELYSKAYIQFNFSKYFIDAFEFDSMTLLQINPSFAYSVVHFEPCYYLIRKYYIINLNNDKNEKDIKIKNISDCLMFEKGQEEFENIFINGAEDNKGIERKIKIELIDVKDKRKDVKRIFGERTSNYYWKIFQSNFPLISDKFLYSSDFLVNYNYYTLLFKDTSDTRSEGNKLYMKYFRLVLLILYYFIFFWIIIEVIIYIINIKEIGNIFVPIYKLINAVNNFNSQDNEEAINDLKNLSFKDDEDIQELFDTCKNMLLGGFRGEGNEEILKHQKELEYESNLNRIYNSISTIKINNFIILKEELFLKNGNNIFTYIKKDGKGGNFQKILKKQIATNLVSSIGTYKNPNEDNIDNDDENELEIKNLCEIEENNLKSSQDKKDELEILFDEIVKDDL